MKITNYNYSYDKSGKYQNLHPSDKPIATFRSKRFGMPICLYQLSSGAADCGFGCDDKNGGIGYFDFRLPRFDSYRVGAKDKADILDVVSHISCCQYEPLALANDIVASITEYLGRNET